jgi:hypothetical protein
VARRFGLIQWTKRFTTVFHEGTKGQEDREELWLKDSVFFVSLVTS